MKRFLLGSAAAVSAVFGLLAGAAPAQAAEGPVVVFRNELLPLSVYNDPSGCHQLPLAATVVTNQTNGNITVYIDPFCTIAARPFSTITPGHGAHVLPTGGSFAVS
ncbi:hypothetical protein [Herbidospora cretacea]|uniref:hypothetical protein n=1 Tax=Herbidospora cretacea TaxID=28444 RepID=UPI000773284C|nr:hypothetical protein [Herbidospora cretacea]